MTRTLRSTLRRRVRTLGLDVRRIDRAALSADGEYDLVLPRATYSPWNADHDFREIFERVQNSTLVDVYRCYEIWKLVEQTAKLPEGDLIEIGVWRGGTGAIIASQASRCGISGLVYLCDTFVGVVKAGAEDSSYTGGEHSDTSPEVVKRLVGSMCLDKVRLLSGIFPEETGDAVEAARFRFCHIDVDVYRSAADILEWIWPRMVSGGVIVYDDFGFRCCPGITRHVESQLSLPDRLVLHNLNGHAVIVKLPAGSG